MAVSSVKTLRIFALYTVYSFIKTNKALSREVLNKVENNPHNLEDKQEINFDSKGHLIWYNEDADEYATKNKLTNMPDTKHRVKVEQRDYGMVKKRNDSKFYKKFLNNLNLYNMTPVENQEDWLANSLRTNVRVLCWVELTNRQEFKHHWHIMVTWGKRCSKLLFFSTQNHPSIPIVNLNKTDSTWDMTKETIIYLYKNHLSDADWFLITDDETYMIMENLRYMLSAYNPDESIYFGLRNNAVSEAKKFTTNGAGYVLSRKAVEEFGYYSPFKCKQDNADFHMCLMHMLVKTIDTRDSLRRERLLITPNPFTAYQRLEFWHSYFKGSQNKNMICCSDFAISFHQIPGDHMHVMEYFVYHLRPYGVRFADAHQITGRGIKILNQLKKKISSTEFIVEAYFRERDRIYADRSVADNLARRVRVLCWVMTCPKNHKRKAIHVKATWGKRCNVLLFMSTASDPTLPTIVLPVEGDYHHLWGKTKAAFRYVHEHHLGDAEWFMKVDDDTFVIVENLRYMLSKYNADDPLYFGLHYRTSDLMRGYMAGGPGYVLSRAALDTLVTEGLPYPHLCLRSDQGSDEDVKMGSCLTNIGVKAMDSRDSMGRGRFFYERIIVHFFPNTDRGLFLKSISEYSMPETLQCCSKYAISFHYTTPAEMDAMEYFIYHLKPYGYSWNGTEPEELLSLKLDYGR